VSARVSLAAAVFVLAACRAAEPPAADQASARSLLLVTIDTLRADAVGAGRTPAIDALASEGVRFDRAFAPAPTTLPSHASLLTGMYPPGHGARHNGISMRRDVPTLATTAEAAGFATAAFVSAFPLDRRFGLGRGFAVYDDRLPRGADLRPLNERVGASTVDAAIVWIETTLKGRATGGEGRATGEAGEGRSAPQRFFLWVHLFEPHAPYSDARTGRSARERYSDEVAEADRQTKRLIDALGATKAATLIVVAGDHGEAFGEHGEIGHSIFVYDTTLRVPLVMSGPRVPRGRAIAEPVSLVDVAPTVLRLLGIAALGPSGVERPAPSGVEGPGADGVDLSALWDGAGRRLTNRALYAESFAPLVDFGWSALRSIRRSGWKYIAAPRAELYDLTRDPGETTDVTQLNAARAAELDALVSRISGPELERAETALDPEAASRLRALGYAQGSTTRGGAGLKGGASNRPDPKDRRAIAARIARVTSGELAGKALLHELDAIVAEDPSNPQARLRLGFAHAEAGACADAERHFAAAIEARVPSADPYLGLAGCQARRGDRDGALRTLERALSVDANDTVVLANIGILRSSLGRHAGAIAALERTLARDAEFHEARFNLALAFARAGRREDAARQAQILLDRLPPQAPQRAEVQRFRRALR
jgi:arylsulfatase A-like enzyme/thioredoxin-like negative regulator of GroEL